MPLAITPTFRPCTHTSDDRYIYQLSLVVAIATVSSRTEKYTLSVVWVAVWVWVFTGFLPLVTVRDEARADFDTGGVNGGL